MCGVHVSTICCTVGGATGKPTFKLTIRKLRWPPMLFSVAKLLVCTVFVDTIVQTVYVEHFGLSIQIKAPY